MKSYTMKKSMMRRIGAPVAAIIGAITIGFTSAGALEVALAGSDEQVSSVIAAPGYLPRPELPIITIPVADTSGFREWHENPGPGIERAGKQAVPAVVAPAGRGGAVMTYEEMRFLEFNLAWPVVLKPEVLSYDMMRFLEINLWPESVSDDAAVPPSPREGFSEF